MKIVPILSMGGKGVISVLSNCCPKATSRLCHAWFEGNTAEAVALQCEYLPLINALFSEVNPIPVKAAMAAMGFAEEYIRLPLTPMDEGKKAALLEIMKGRGLI